MSVDQVAISVLLVVIWMGLFSGLLGIKYGNIVGLTYEQKTKKLIFYLILIILLLIGFIVNTFLR